MLQEDRNKDHEGLEPSLNLVIGMVDANYREIFKIHNRVDEIHKELNVQTRCSKHGGQSYRKFGPKLGINFVIAGGFILGLCM